MPKRLPRIVWRIIDANTNRAREGLRTVEECVRLGWNDRGLTARCRALRHRIGQVAGTLPGGRTASLTARDSQRDVGRWAAPRRTTRRWPQLISDNVRRTEEALRVLEECARLIAPRTAARFHTLRFATYALERTLCLRLVALRHPRRRRPRRA